jgi:transposase
MPPRKYELSPKRVSAAARQKLRRVIERSRKDNDLKTWTRARAVLRYIEGTSAAEIAAELDSDRSTVSRWVAGYAQRGIPALTPTKPPGLAPKLAEEQLLEVGRLVEAGPEAAGFTSGVWTARMIGALIEERFGVTYHWKYVPELLHKLGFSVQRPRKQLSRADHAAQEYWLRNTLPRLKKKPGVKAP